MVVGVKLTTSPVMLVAAAGIVAKLNSSTTANPTPSILESFFFIDLYFFLLIQDILMSP
jgi:hypothetical protein